MKARKISLQAMRSLRRYRLRTTLMMLGILVGIASLAVLSSLGEATKRETMQRFKNMLGTFDAIIVRPGGGRTRGMPTLVNVPPTLLFDDASAIATELPEIKAVAEVQNAFDIDVKYRERTSSPAIFGVSPNWLALRSEEVADGVFFTTEQNASWPAWRFLVSTFAIKCSRRRSSWQDDPHRRRPFEVIGLLKSAVPVPRGPVSTM